MVSIELTWESWEEFSSDALALMQEEYDEYETLFGLEPMELNHQELMLASNAGRLNVLCARDRGVPVGYFMVFISMDPEVQWQVIAAQGAWYVKDDVKYVRLGLRLWSEAMGFIRGLGIKLVDLHHPIAGRGAKLEKFFLRKGARPMNKTYRLKL